MLDLMDTDQEYTKQKVGYAEDILGRLDTLLAERFPAHPFDSDISRENFEAMIPQYVAMSTAFPYIQAGAMCACYESNLRRGIGIDDRLAVSTAVAAYVVWDEFGSIGSSSSDVMAEINILPDFDRKFHFALLTRDIEGLLGQKLGPCLPDTATTAYLAELKAGLSDPIDNECIIHMLAFERHAMAMISSLDRAVKRLFGTDQCYDLGYFDAHVGSVEAGEAIHVAMTGGMVARLIAPHEIERFLTRCADAYALNFNWCRHLIGMAPTSA